jgi:hypothetical protein
VRAVVTLADLRLRIDELTEQPEPPAWLVKVQLFADATLTNRKRIVALSGGKDSTAMALMLAVFEPADYNHVITPTGNELPEMFEHWRKLADLLGRPLMPLMKVSLQGLIRQQRALPNHRARWCTRIIKLDTYYKWLAAQTPCISYVGLRADEESRPGMILTLDLFPYQREGAAFLARKERAGLFDDMGVGKSAQAIAALDAVKAMKVLIVCPAAVREVWVGEFKKFSRSTGASSRAGTFTT